MSTERAMDLAVTMASCFGAGIFATRVHYGLMPQRMGVLAFVALVSAFSVITKRKTKKIKDAAEETWAGPRPPR